MNDPANRGDAPPVARKPASGFAEEFTPKFVSVLREGYGLAAFRADAVAGLTVAIVALPLSMAIAIACGLSPDRGLYTAIVGGFIISAFGGSRFQIGGPAGAFIVLIATIVERHGYDGLVLATIMAGAIMLVAGLLRLGNYIRYIPFPVTVGFTAGIAIIIFASQLKEFFGLEMAREPAAFVPKLAALWAAMPGFRPAALAIAALTMAVILLTRRYRPGWPAFLIAVAAASAASFVLGLDIATIGTRFGGVPSALPAPHIPEITLTRLASLLPDALAIALLGSIESLLSAVVADGMSGRRHRSNCELVAQGGANIASVIFGGVPVTGTIARTATNVRAGAHGPVSGMLHAAYLLVFMMIAAPLAKHIPLAALAGLLVVVSWNMAEKHEFGALLRASPGDAVVLLSTFLLTVFVDLTIGIAVGVTLGAFIFLHNMAGAMEIEDARAPEAEPVRQDDDTVVYRISGALFFGAAATMVSTLERIGRMPGRVIFDLSGVPMADSTAARGLEAFAGKLRGSQSVLVIAGARPGVRRVLHKAGLTDAVVRYAASVEEARREAVEKT